MLLPTRWKLPPKLRASEVARSFSPRPLIGAKSLSNLRAEAPLYIGGQSDEDHATAYEGIEPGSAGTSPPLVLKDEAPTRGEVSPSARKAVSRLEWPPPAYPPKRAAWHPP